MADDWPLAVDSRPIENNVSKDMSDNEKVKLYKFSYVYLLRVYYFTTKPSLLFFGIFYYIIESFKVSKKEVSIMMNRTSIRKNSI